MDTLGKELCVLISCILGSFRTSSLNGESVSLVLHSLWCDQSLNLWCLGVWLGTLFLWHDFSSNDEFSGRLVSVPSSPLSCINIPDIILLGETEELSNLGCSLRAKSLGVDNVGQAWNVAITLLDD